MERELARIEGVDDGRERPANARARVGHSIVELVDALGDGVRVVEASFGVLDADIVVADAPERWGCLWRWRTSCGRALRGAEVPVYVAARAPRSLRRCVIAVSPLFDVRRLPPWLRCFEVLELLVATDPDAYDVVGGTPFPAVYPAERGRKAALRLIRDCERMMKRLDGVTQAIGRLDVLLAERVRGARADVVFLADDVHLPRVIDDVGAAAIVAPLLRPWPLPARFWTVP